jgi:hypothetical protein
MNHSSVENQAMWTCKKCGEQVEDDFEVCWSCGTTREGFEDAAFDPETEGVMGDQAYQARQVARQQEQFVTVASFWNALEAHMVRSRLEAEAIHAYVTEELARTALWGMVNDAGGVKLQVAESDVPRARLILATMQHPSVRETEEADDDERIQAATDLQGIKKIEPEDQQR